MNADLFAVDIAGCAGSQGTFVLSALQRAPSIRGLSAAESLAVPGRDSALDDVYHEVGLTRRAYIEQVTLALNATRHRSHQG